MKLSKTQIIYIFTSVMFIMILVFIPVFKILHRNKKNGDVIAPELANIKEMGKTRILEGVSGNATFILKLKYEDPRRHSSFERALSEHMGFDTQKYHVFILEVTLNDVTPQTKPSTLKDEIEKTVKKFELPVINLRLLPQNIKNINLAELKPKNTTTQGQMYLTLHNSPISLVQGQKTFRYVFFNKDFDFNDIDTAELPLANKEIIILKALEKK